MPTDVDSSGTHVINSKNYLIIPSFISSICIKPKYCRYMYKKSSFAGHLVIFILNMIEIYAAILI